MNRDKVWLVYTQSVPVIFEPPCTLKVPRLLMLHCLKNQTLFLCAQKLYTNNCSGLFLLCKQWCRLIVSECNIAFNVRFCTVSLRKSCLSLNHSRATRIQSPHPTDVCLEFHRYVWNLWWMKKRRTVLTRRVESRCRCPLRLIIQMDVFITSVGPSSKLTCVCLWMRLCVCMYVHSKGKGFPLQA